MFDLKPAGPFTGKALNQRRMDSSRTLRMEAMTEYEYPSITETMAWILFTVRRSPLRSAFFSMSCSALKVAFVRLTRKLGMVRLHLHRVETRAIHDYETFVPLNPAGFKIFTVNNIESPHPTFCNPLKILYQTSPSPSFTPATPVQIRLGTPKHLSGLTR